MEELIKEVYAHFGLAYYLGEVLHRGLCNTYALLSFEKPKDITRPRLEEKFSYAFSLTLGQIMRELEPFFPLHLNKELQVALAKRNFLAHHFWYERIHLMSNEPGLTQMLNELHETSQLFEELDQKVNDILKPHRIRLGLTDEVTAHIMGELASGVTEEPLLSQRRLRKQERLVKVWDVKVSDNLVAQIFELEDGTLWQLCDKGIGWSRFEKPSPSWQKNQAIKEFIPANINPRPLSSRSWEYEFLLKKRMILWVKPGKEEGSYSWGLKESSTD
jgi:hypothetical protein